MCCRSCQPTPHIFELDGFLICVPTESFIKVNMNDTNLCKYSSSLSRKYFSKPFLHILRPKIENVQVFVEPQTQYLSNSKPPPF